MFKTEIKNIFDSIMYDRDYYSVVSDFFEMSAIAIRNAVDFRERDEYERRYAAIAQHYTQDRMTCFARALALFQDEISSALNGGEFRDWAGEVYMESNTYNKSVGQFFTPYSVSQVLARTSLRDEDIRAKLSEDSDAVFTIHEPTCGAGGLIVAAIEKIREMGVNYAWNVFVDCGDIDARCVHMTYLTLSLLGVPAVVRLGDALMLKYREHWFTPAYILAFPHFKKRLQGGGYPLRATVATTKVEKTEKVEPDIPKMDKHGQLSLF